MFDVPADPAFDRITRLVARLLHAPLTLYSVLDSGDLAHKSAHGFDKPDVTPCEIAVARLLSRQVSSTGKPAAIADARKDLTLVSAFSSPGTHDPVACIGAPIVVEDTSSALISPSASLRSGRAAKSPTIAGVLSAFDRGHRVWTEDDIATLTDLAAFLVSEIQLQRTRARLEEQADELRRASLVDELTNLHNRRGFMLLGEQGLRLAVRNKAQVLVFFVDLDGMKAINDTLGHKTGDLALLETADILRETFRKADVLARLGGDEFVVFAHDAAPGAERVIVLRIYERVAEHNRTPDRTFRLALSVGVARMSTGNRSLDGLIDEADAAMYREKQKRRSLRI